MDYSQQFNYYLSQVENELNLTSNQYLPNHSVVAQAAKYSLLSGGKRVRAVLMLACCDMISGDFAKALMPACSIEMLHCYSLIHDDLPCMDNDDYRRGKPSCHKAFGYANALLAGDLLLTECFHVLSEAKLSSDITTKLVKVLSSGAGSFGMVYGQELDLKFENHDIAIEQLLQIHKCKTGALIKAAMLMGAICGNASEDQLKAVEYFADQIGLVFQIVDDILDVTSTTEVLGKPIGSDSEQGKQTFATLLGVEASKVYAHECNKKACDRLRDCFGDKADFLIQFAYELEVRSK